MIFSPNDFINHQSKTTATRQKETQSVLEVSVYVHLKYRQIDNKGLFNSKPLKNNIRIKHSSVHSYLPYITTSLILFSAAKCFFKEYLRTVQTVAL